MTFGDFIVIPAVSEGGDMRPRASVRIGDIVRHRVTGIMTQFRSPRDIRQFYRAVGIDYWTEDVDWL